MFNRNEAPDGSTEQQFYFFTSFISFLKKFLFLFGEPRWTANRCVCMAFYDISSLSLLFISLFFIYETRYWIVNCKMCDPSSIPAYNNVSSCENIISKKTKTTEAINKASLKREILCCFNYNPKKKIKKIIIRFPIG